MEKSFFSEEGKTMDSREVLEARLRAATDAAIKYLRANYVNADAVTISVDGDGTYINVDHSLDCNSRMEMK